MRSYPRSGKYARSIVDKTPHGLYIELPKGHVERGTSAQHAAERELREEAGLIPDVEVGPRIGRESYRVRGGEQVVDYYLTTIVEPVTWDSREAATREQQWVTEAKF